MAAQMTFDGSLFIYRCAYGEQAPAKAAGFRWHPDSKSWRSADRVAAAKLTDYADEKAKGALIGIPVTPLTAEPTLRFVNGVYEFRCQREQNEPAKQAGFRWTPSVIAWTTGDALAASQLRNYADTDALSQLDTDLAAMNASINASRAESADIELPVPAGLMYLPCQRAGISYAMARPACLIGDEMGLGKTIQAIGVYNALPIQDRAPKMLVICPASLRLNWVREITKWSVHKAQIAYANGDFWPQGFDVVVINYDILERHRQQINAVKWDLLVVDECHYLKNPKAKRTQIVFGVKAKKDQPAIEPIKAERKVFLTGTPIGNRPIELWPLVQALDPNGLGSNWKRFVSRYCNAAYNGYAMDTSGASNLDELQQKLRATIMVRRMKADVLTELPPKRRQVIELSADGASAAVKAEQETVSRVETAVDAARIRVELAKAAEDEREYEEAVKALRHVASVAFTEISKVRHSVALAKLPHVIEHCKSCEGKVIVFCHHKDVAQALTEELGAVTVTGDTKLEDRQAAVDAFQNNPEVKYFVGTIYAAGVGLTLTASSHVVFAELDWVPGNMNQAEDRAHRIGQRDSVLVQHVVLEGSLDARMAKVLVEKQEVITAALDAKTELVQEGEALFAPESDQIEMPEAGEPPATRSITRAQVIKEAETVDPEQKAAVHICLKILAGVCDGAYARDNVGFNGADTAIGKHLAFVPELTARQTVLGSKIIRKYHRQLPDELLEKSKNVVAS